ncbi:hypothetical protein [Kineosporia sp. NBRC 101731]|uniref:hypothetical protein n=1 Tax=Kineosporia sp. NBRC 101731 TaxID=3032199 RepID=UPI0024A21D19|nr:hypothetical protein [Kineosporia sp. NBRC 101731]GLY30049.1 hypothetical protein Kisp02_34140 [Kineosporia sp. NBRC 101731]
MVSKQSVVARSLVVLPLAALLLAGCGEDTDARIEQLNDSANSLNDGAQQLEDATENLDLDQAEENLRNAAENLGEAGQAKAACSAVSTVVGTSEGDGTKAATARLAATVSTIFATVGDESGTDLDLDAMLQETCPAVHEQALGLIERDSLNELYSN